MKKLLFICTLILSVFSGIAQSNFINYQGLVTDDIGEPIVSQSITVDLAIRFGTDTSVPVYEEIHTVNTDAFGVFSLQIGNGTPVSGDYMILNWGMDDAFVTTSIDGTEIGTTEFNAVPFAIATLNGTSDNWNTNGTDVYNANIGNVGIGTSTPGAKFMVKGTGSNPTLNVVTSTGTIPSLRVNDNGRVGVGTDMPGAKLMVVGEAGAPTLNILSPMDDAASPSIRVNEDRNVGIGTSTPGAKFMVKGTGSNPTLNVVTSTGTIPSLRVNDNGRVGVGTDMPGAKLMVVGEMGAPALNILPQSGSISALRVNDNGRVGIGTTMPNEELEVNGDVMADSFIAPGMTYADYVFEVYYDGESTLNDDYQFNSLEQVESFIKDNGHIKGYKSIKELKKDEQGRYLININEQSNTNQEKIEELFLHTIELNKQIKTQQEYIKQQQKEIEELKKMFNKVLSKK